MDFQTFAASETSNLFERVLGTQSARALEQLQAVREALDAAARALDAPADVEPGVRQLVDRLAGAADDRTRQVQAEAQAAIGAAQGEASARLEEVERLRAMMVQAEAEAAVLRTELETANERAQVVAQDLETLTLAHGKLETAYHALEAEAHTLLEAGASAEGRLTATAGDLAARTAELAARSEELAARSGELAARNEELTARGQALAALEQQLADARAAADLSAAEAAELKASLQYQQEERERMQAERDRLATELDAAAGRVQSLEVSLASAQEALVVAREVRTQAPATADAGADPDALYGEVDRMLALFDASARAVTEMAAANSSDELLSELVKRLSLQFTRVAMFRLRGNRLEGVNQVGFEDSTDLSKLAMPTAVDSMITRAIATCAMQTLAGTDVPARSGTPFGGTPSLAVALPIVVQGAPIGVVYADDSDVPESARGPAVHESSVGFARLLVGQVVALLARHTHELKMLSELSQYASTLLQEAKEMYLADAQAGKNGELLRSRLKDNIDCASQLYAYRAAMEGTAAAGLLDDQIAAELQESTPFARDLALVIQQMADASVHLTAEAS